MVKKTKPEQDNKKQSQQFVETAKALGVDESGKSFERAIKVVVPPVSRPAPGPTKPRRSP